MKLEVGLWTVDNEFDFKIRALHCTPLEFITGFLVGAFNLKVATILSLPAQHQANKTSISWISVQLFILMSADEMMDWLLWPAVSWF